MLTKTKKPMTVFFRFAKGHDEGGGNRRAGGVCAWVRRATERDALPPRLDVRTAAVLAAAKQPRVRLWLEHSRGRREGLWSALPPTLRRAARTLGWTPSCYGPRGVCQDAHALTTRHRALCDTRRPRPTRAVSQEHTSLAMAGKTSLGPAAYKLPPSVGGKQPDGRKANPPVWKFGTARARLLSNPPSFEGDRRPDYGPQPMLGPGQTLSRVRSEPAFGFGSAGRATAKKVFISSSHQRLDLYGMESPGPAHYASQSTIGRRGALARCAITHAAHMFVSGAHDHTSLAWGHHTLTTHHAARARGRTARVPTHLRPTAERGSYCDMPRFCV